jgi:hypothetical protein
LHWFPLATLALVAGCGAGPGVDEQSPRAVDSMGGQRTDPAAMVVRCQSNGIWMEGPCWTALVNPSSSEMFRTARLQAAVDHRRAESADLRDAEALSCAGVSPEDRNASPLQHDGDTVGFAEIRASDRLTSSWEKRLMGASVRVRAVPGLTVERLQHLVDCHIKRNLAAGYALTEMESCPLSLRGVRAVVAGPSGGVFTVSISSDDGGTALEILKRSKTLAEAR